MTLPPRSLLLGQSRPGRSLRSQLLVWQIGTLLLVILALGIGTLLFTEQYVTAQFMVIRQQQAQGILSDSDLALLLENTTQDTAIRDEWMSNWRETTGAALMVSWNDKQDMAFDALTPELAQAFISESGEPLKADGEGKVTVQGQPYYWKGETLFSGQRKAGLAVVAFALPRRAEVLWQITRQRLPLMGVVVLLALLSSYLLSRQLKRTLLNLEPSEIAALTLRQEQLLGTVTDGVIVLDAADQVTVANAPAAQTLQISALPVPLREVWLEWPAQTAPLRRAPLALRGRVMLVNVTPLPAGGHLVAFTGRQEAAQLAEELTDTRRFVDAMRARAHEYGNRLHVIAGFLQLGRPDEALSIIQGELDTEAELGQALAQIEQPRVAALLAGKMARARELHLTLTLDPDSEVPPDLSPDQADALVTALGNYIENAFEVLSAQSNGQIIVDIGLDPDGLSAEVRDNGPGLPPDFDPFAAGQTTKGTGRGQGLAITAGLAHAVGAEVWHQRRGGWTVFGLNLPTDMQENEHD